MKIKKNKKNWKIITTQYAPFLADVLWHELIIPANSIRLCRAKHPLSYDPTLRFL